MFPGFTLSLALWTLFAPHLDYCCLPGLSLFALPLLDIVCRSSTHACPKDYSVSCPCHTCLLFIDPACIMTMFWNKALHMDPHVSRLVRPVTEYSATQGSSGFHEQYCPVCTLQNYYYPSSRVSDHSRTLFKNI